MSEHHEDAILISYLPSRIGEAAFVAGMREAKERGLPAVLVNAPRRGAAVDRNMIDVAASKALVDRAHDAGVTLTVVQPVHEDPVTAISQVAKEGSYRLLVLGIRKRSQVGKLLLGSTAQRILLELDLPILAVKSDDR